MQTTSITGKKLIVQKRVFDSKYITICGWPRNKKEVNRMQAHVYLREEDEGGSNAGCGSSDCCVDGKVHVRYSYSWYDQTGCEDKARDTATWEVLGPCDGSCRQDVVEIPPVADALVAEFLANGKRGNLSMSALRYQDVSYDDMLNSDDESVRGTGSWLANLAEQRLAAAKRAVKELRPRPVRK